ncbi:MAG: hydrogenase expression/formation protein HypE [Candidatus Cloacimonadota bacterium]|nr:hydrogenase expression/formation protein HypE [Candidatus Cloacimonadota bacterium]
MKNRITLGHGSGAGLTRKLIEDVFDNSFKMPKLEDGCYIGSDMIISTDCHIISPIFFPGGDIGKLSITGTVNDVAVMGAIPQYIVAGFIIEEGFEIDDLKKIVDSMKEEAKKAGVKIIGGDTKVVPKGKADKIFITTTGVGKLLPNINLDSHNIQAGDSIIISGTIADHSVAIINAREKMKLEPEPQSDCASLNEIAKVIAEFPEARLMRDATRGGVATILNEIADETQLGIEIEEDKIPIKQSVEALTEMLGMDPLYMANEGKLICFAGGDVIQLLEKIKNHPLGKDAKIIGKVTDAFKGVYLTTVIGGKRPLLMQDSDPLPRIC